MSANLTCLGLKAHANFREALGLYWRRPSPKGSTIVMWRALSLSGSGGLTIAATATLNLNVPGFGFAIVSGSTLTNQGSVQETAANPVNCAFQVVKLGVVNNAGNWTINSDVLVQADTTAVVFNNSGSLSKSGGTGASAWSVPISGSGQINQGSGTLNLNGKLTASITGPIAVQASATLLYGQGGTLAGSHRSRATAR